MNVAVFTVFICGCIFWKLLKILTYYLTKNKWKNKKTAEKQHYLNMTACTFRHLLNKI